MLLGVFPEATSLMTGNQVWSAPTVELAYKDLKIWREALPLSFLQQSATKELDGYYYPALVYYQPARYHKDISPFSRVFKSSTQTIKALSTVTDSVTEEDLYYCKDSAEVFDGHSC